MQETAPQIKQSEIQNASQFTAIVYFKREHAIMVGTKHSSEHGRKFHSYKQEIRMLNGEKMTDHKFAWKCMHEMINRDFFGKYKTAIIYWNKTGEMVGKYMYDKLRYLAEPIYTNSKDGGLVVHTFKKGL
jgi:hypothetical protein